MNTTRKLLFSIFVSVLVLVGCGGGNNISEEGLDNANNANNTTNEGNSDMEIDEEQKILEMWTRDHSRPNVEAIAEAFNEEDMGFQVNVTAFPAANFTDQLVSAFTSGSGPDILSLDLIFAPYFSSIDALVDLSDFYNELDYQDDLIEAMVEMGSYEGSQYALPFSADVSAMFYNRTHFEEAGLDPDSPPETWEEFREATIALTTDDRYGYAYAGADVGGQAFTFLPFMWSNGADVLSPDGSEVLINSPEAIEALEFYTELTQDDQVTPAGVTNYSWTEAQDAFQTETASIVINGNFLPNTLNTDYPDLDWDVALIPKKEGKEHSSFTGGELITIPNTTDEIEDAKVFIDYALSEYAQVEVFAKAGSIPVREDLFDNEYFNNEPRYQVFTDGLLVGNTPYSLDYNEIFGQPVLSALQRSLGGEISPQEAFENAEAEIQRIIDGNQ